MSEARFEAVRTRAPPNQFDLRGADRVRPTRRSRLLPPYPHDDVYRRHCDSGFEDFRNILRVTCTTVRQARVTVGGLRALLSAIFPCNAMQRLIVDAHVPHIASTGTARHMSRPHGLRLRNRLPPADRLKHPRRELREGQEFPQATPERDQSSPRSRSSRRMGSGIAATLAAAAFPRSGGTASWVK